MPASIPNDIYQYSLFSAYTSGLQDGGPPAAFLASQGTHGIGVFEAEPVDSDAEDEDEDEDENENGSVTNRTPSQSLTQTQTQMQTPKPHDMVQIDSIAYSIDEDGAVTRAAKDDSMPFVMVTVFEPQQRAKLPVGTDGRTLQGRLRRNTPVPFAIAGHFRYINTRQRTYWDVSGRIFGFVIPVWQREVSGEGLQARFLSADSSQGGGVLDFETGPGAAAEWARCGRFHLGFPQDEEFEDLKLT